jgi:hypothetical protein
MNIDKQVMYKIRWLFHASDWMYFDSIRARNKELEEYVC